ncbi:MAG: Dabb family protein [Verrucomicrobia bacterium]|nr:Dabb family protein [Verrucomicrobiota bacterium]
MKTVSVLLTVAIALALCAHVSAADPVEKEKNAMLRHVVAFKFKETATPDQIKTVEDAFRDLKKKIPQIASYEWGTNNSPEGLNKGFTHSFILSFKSEADRSAYLPHPDHKAFGKLLGPLIADVFVIDFWAKD